MAAHDSPFDVARLLDLLEADAGPGGPVWTHTSADLNVNLLRFDARRGVPEHVNDELDVLIVCLAGQGELAVNGAPYELAAGVACVVPKGAHRSIRALSDGFAYLTCHRRRGGLMPV